MNKLHLSICHINSKHFLEIGYKENGEVIGQLLEKVDKYSEVVL